jgi:hypothetical protein
MNIAAIDPHDTDGCANAGDCWNIDKNNPARVCLGKVCGDYLESTAHRQWMKEHEATVEVGEEPRNTGAYDPFKITGWCETAMSGKCPYEQRVLCIKESHDICRTGKFQESREGILRSIEAEERRNYRSPNPHMFIVILANGAFAEPVDIGG